MLGYMRKGKAIAEGFTHEGSYYGIPCWLGGIGADDGGLMVAAKWFPFEYLMTVFHHIEGTLRTIFFPQDEPGFQFHVGRKIKDKHHG